MRVKNSHYSVIKDVFCTSTSKLEGSAARWKLLEKYLTAAAADDDDVCVFLTLNPLHNPSFSSSGFISLLLDQLGDNALFLALVQERDRNLNHVSCGFDSPRHRRGLWQSG